MVLLITWAKVHPFLALILGSVVLGAVATMPVSAILASFSAGFGLTVGETIKSWSLMETVISVVGFALVLLLNLVL